MHKTTSHEITIQCKRCQDVFDVVLTNRRGELGLEPTLVAALEIDPHDGSPRLLHRPGHCGGECRTLSGSWASLFPKWASYDPLAQ